jgi:hypothetical protein
VVAQSHVFNSSVLINAIQFNGWNVETSSSTQTSSPNCGGLSTGAKAGIGVSAAIGGIGIFALIGAFFLFRRRPKAARYTAALPSQTDMKQSHEQVHQPIHELGSQPEAATEMPSHY